MKSSHKFLLVLSAILVVSALIFAASNCNRYHHISKANNSLAAELQGISNAYNYLYSDYINLIDEYNSLVEDYNVLLHKCDSLSIVVDSLNCQKTSWIIPYSLISLIL